MNTKLSIWSFYYRTSPEEAVREFKAHGIDAMELSDEHGAMLLERGEPAEVGRAFREFLAEAGMDCSQGHLWLACKFCTEGALEKLFRWVDLYEAVGVKNAVLHCDGLAAFPELPMEEKLAKNLEKLLVLQDYLAEKGYGIRICLENLNAIVNNIDDLLWLVNRLEEKHFGICLDTGHLNLNDGDQVNFIRRAGGRLHALHIADNEGKTDQHMMPFGTGGVNFAAVVSALREIGYSDLFNLEIPGETRPSVPMPVRGYKLEYIRKCYEYLMENA